MKKGKTMEMMNGETPLPEAMIQHIQSFMSGKEAARSTILSRSWYNAWLTRPTIDLDEQNFFNLAEFDKYAKKTMQRYQDSNLKIDCFRISSYKSSYPEVLDLIADAMKIGAAYLRIGLPGSGSFILPHEVLGSETLVELSAVDCEIDGKCSIRCSGLKYLNLSRVEIKTSSGKLRDIISCCSCSLEELSLNYCRGQSLRNLAELPKLRRLVLCQMFLDDDTFFVDFASRFPSLKDLSILYCFGWKSIHISSNSLESITFKSHPSERVRFDVPNIRKFTYRGKDFPNYLSIGAGSREWELDMTIASYRFRKISWFKRMKKMLKKLRPSRIVSFSMNIFDCEEDLCSKHGGTVDHIEEVVAPKPLAVENLMIDVPCSLCCVFLVRFFGIFRPKFITSYWFSDAACEGGKNESLDLLYKRLMQRLITPNYGIPDQDLLGPFNLKRVKMEVYEMYGTEWRPLPSLNEPLDVSKTPASKRKISFELMWD